MKILKSKKAEVFVDTGVKILIAVVIGSLLLGGTYALTKNTVLPTVNDKVNEMFNYSGGGSGGSVSEETEPTIISFYYGNKLCHAVSGMTWYQYSQSEYNTVLYSDCNGWMTVDEETAKNANIRTQLGNVKLNSNYVYASDYIVENATYTLPTK